MERYVVSRELAEKLKAAGYEQYESKYRYYYGDGYDGLLLDEHMWSQHFADEGIREGEIVAAPLTDELLEQLPNVIENKDDAYPYYLLVQNPFTTDRRAHYHTVGGGSGRLRTTLNDTAIAVANKQCDALAELWLWCKEHGYLDDPAPAAGKEEK